MSSNNSTTSKEQRILKTMRQALASIVRDTTPEPGMRHPLSDQTIETIKMCFSLISSREQELLQDNDKQSNLKPRYVDEPRSSEVIHFVGTKKSRDPE